MHILLDLLDQGEIELLEKAKPILEMGPSWAARDFIEDLLWNGFASSDGTRYFQVCQLRELITLYGV